MISIPLECLPTFFKIFNPIRHLFSSGEPISNNVISKFTLNRKQEIVFRMAISNVIKRENKESTEQIMVFVAGHGGTGKSQVIKAIIWFQESIKRRNQLRSCAYTGTAAKSICRSTIISLGGIFAIAKSELRKINVR